MSAHSEPCDHIVWSWLHSLGQSALFCNFLEHGYDDLETVKQLGEEDLLAIGVQEQEVRDLLRHAARRLR